MGLASQVDMNGATSETIPGRDASSVRGEFQSQWKYFLQQLINGLTLGSIYGLIAIGYTMVFGIIGMVNFAHGDVFMVVGLHRPDRLPDPDAAWLGVAVVALALLIVLIVGMLADRLWNWTIERVAYRPLRGSFRLAPLISAIGMSIFLSNFVQVAAGPAQQAAAADAQRRHHAHRRRRATTSSLSYKQIIIVVVTAVLLVGLLVRWCRRRRSAAPSAPASRTARWPRCSASTSTAPSRSPSSWARRSPPSPA